MQYAMSGLMTMRATKPNTAPTTPPIIAPVDEPLVGKRVVFGSWDGSKRCAESDNEACVETGGWRKTCVGSCSLVCVGDGIAVEREKCFHNITNQCQGIQCACEVWTWQAEFCIGELWQWKEWTGNALVKLKGGLWGIVLVPFSH